MKYLRFIAAVLVLIAATSCLTLEDPVPSAKAITKEATNISLDGFTLNGEVEYEGSTAYVADGGVFFSSKPNVSEKQYILSSATVTLSKGKTKICKDVKNYMDTGVKRYYIAAGGTCYYRAYVRIFGDGTDKYILGEEKSFVVPAE